MAMSLQYLLSELFGGYIDGLENAEAGEYKDLVLRTDLVNEDLKECGSPLYFKDGVIGKVKISMTWSGTCKFELENVSMEIGFSAGTALQNVGNGLKNLAGFGGAEKEDDAEELAKRQKAQMERGKENAKSAFFCERHDSSEKRQKGIPKNMTCQACKGQLQTNYVDFHYCPQCSQQKQMCMICGEPKKALKEINPDEVGDGTDFPSARKIENPNRRHSKAAANSGMPAANSGGASNRIPSMNNPPPPAVTAKADDDFARMAERIFGKPAADSSGSSTTIQNNGREKFSPSSRTGGGVSPIRGILNYKIDKNRQHQAMLAAQQGGNQETVSNLAPGAGGLPPSGGIPQAQPSSTRARTRDVILSAGGNEDQWNQDRVASMKLAAATTVSNNLPAPSPPQPNTLGDAPRGGTYSPTRAGANAYGVKTDESFFSPKSPKAPSYQNLLSSADDYLKNFYSSSSATAFDNYTPSYPSYLNFDPIVPSVDFSTGFGTSSSSSEALAEGYVNYPPKPAAVTAGGGEAVDIDAAVIDGASGQYDGSGRPLDNRSLDEYPIVANRPYDSNPISSSGAGGMDSARNGNNAVRLTKLPDPNDLDEPKEDMISGSTRNAIDDSYANAILGIGGKNASGGRVVALDLANKAAAKAKREAKRAEAAAKAGNTPKAAGGWGKISSLMPGVSSMSSWWGKK